MTSTMQTPAPLARLNVSTLNMPVDNFLTWDRRVDGTRIDMDQPYQRGDVWGLTRRRNLIRSMLIGIPIPSLIINDRMSARFRHPGYDADRNRAYAIVDGKQRMTTFLMFLDDKFAIPASWMEPKDFHSTEDTDDGAYVRYSMMNGRGQRSVDMAPIGVCMGHFKTLADERWVFDLVNYGGVAQGAKDED